MPWYPMTFEKGDIAGKKQPISQFCIENMLPMFFIDELLSSSDVFKEDEKDWFLSAISASCCHKN